MNPADITNPGKGGVQGEGAMDAASKLLRQRDQLRAALSEIRAFAERRMAEGTTQHADMQHITNLCKEAA